MMHASRAVSASLSVLLLFACATKPPAPEPKKNAGATWVSYKSPEHGFTLWYPSTWTLDASRETTPSLRITSPDEEAIFLVAVFSDSRLGESGGFEAVIEEIQNVLLSDPKYTFDRLDPWKEDGKLLLGGYSAQGIFTDPSGEMDLFKELGTLLRDGSGFVTTARVHRASRAAYSEILDELIGGFEPFGIPAEKPTMGL